MAKHAVLLLVYCLFFFFQSANSFGTSSVELSALMPDRTEYAYASIKGSTVIASGLSKATSSITDRVDHLNHFTGKWTTLTYRGGARTQMVGAPFGRRLLFAGGFTLSNKTAQSADVYAFSPLLNNWDPMPNLAQAVRVHQYGGLSCYGHVRYVFMCASTTRTQSAPHMEELTHSLFQHTLTQLSFVHVLPCTATHVHTRASPHYPHYR
eukprot:Colp12_sorted_trinity150504_noHs@1771